MMVVFVRATWCDGTDSCKVIERNTRMMAKKEWKIIKSPSGWFSQYNSPEGWNWRFIVLQMRTMMATYKGSNFRCRCSKKQLWKFKVVWTWSIVTVMVSSRAHPMLRGCTSTLGRSMCGVVLLSKVWEVKGSNFWYVQGRLNLVGRCHKGEFVGIVGCRGGGFTLCQRSTGAALG